MPAPAESRKRRRPSGRVLLARRGMLALAAGGLTAVVLLANGVGGDADSVRPAALAPTPVSVWVDLRDQGRPVPKRYLGLSFEISALPQIADYAETGDFASLLRSVGPGVLRFGGISADTRIAWTGPATPEPSWASGVLEASDLRRLRRLAERSGWLIMLTVDLAHYEPLSAAREVAAAKHILGPWLGWIEIGNEPDAYGRHQLRANPWSFIDYDAQVKSYRRAIAALVPGVPLAGPGVSGSHAFARWGLREARAEHPALLTGHHYPLGCGQTPPPSIARLLEPKTRVLEGRSLNRYMTVTRETGIPFRMDETNSVSCGGEAGISDVFASALWATGYIAQTMAAGVSGVNLHGNPANCLGYSPVCASDASRLSAGELNAQPVWYALLLTRGLIGDRPLPTRVTAPAGTNIAITGLRAPSGSLQYVISDDEPAGAAAAIISLHVGRRFAGANALALTAPSAETRTGILLGGHAVSADGSWKPGPPALYLVNKGVVTVRIPPSSAMLVTVTRRRSHG